MGTKRSWNIGAHHHHHHPGSFCKGLDLGMSQSHDGMQVWSILSQGSRRIWGFPGESLCFQGGFPRSEQAGWIWELLASQEGKKCNPGAREEGRENLDPEPPSSLTGRQAGGRGVERNSPKYREFNTEQNSRPQTGLITPGRGKVIKQTAQSKVLILGTEPAIGK